MEDSLTYAKDGYSSMQVQQEQQKMLSLLEDSMQLMALADLSGRITYLNKAGRNLTGVSDGHELQRMQLKDFFMPESAAVFHNQMFTAGFPDRKWSGNMHFRHILTGESIPVHASFYSIPDQAGRSTIALGITARDISAETAERSALAESEKRLHKLVQEAPVAMALYTGNDITIQFANEKMIFLWGKDSSVIGKTLAEALPELDGQPFLELLQKVYTSGVAYQTDEEPATLMISGTLQTSYFNFTYKPLKDENGQVYAILHVAVDVTAKKIVEQQLEQTVLLRTEELRSSNIDLQRSNLELEQFAYIASHDMQEPVRKIFTFSQLLQKSSTCQLGPTDKTYLKKIHDSAGRALSIIRDLLDLSYLNNPERNFTRTDLNEIAGNVLIDLELLILQRKAVVKYDELPVIRAISLQMNQLFYNLINNSLKFSKPESIPELHISSRILSPAQIEEYPALDKSQSYFELVFADNGIGFDQQYASKIFTVFQRLHNRHAFSGTGIGLALCKKVVENHHGEIFAVSEEGKGASFHVILPFKQKTFISDQNEQ